MGQQPTERALRGRGVDRTARSRGAPDRRPGREELDHFSRRLRDGGQHPIERRVVLEMAGDHVKELAGGHAVGGGRRVAEQRREIAEDSGQPAGRDLGEGKAGGRTK